MLIYVSPGTGVSLLQQIGLLPTVVWAFEKSGHEYTFSQPMVRLALR